MPLVTAILAARGVDSVRAFELFKKEDGPTLADPYLMADMDKAVARIRLAMERNEKVAVYGDYDVDGITAGCLLYEYLKDTGLSCELYIPDRLEEGYGLNTGAIDTLKANGVSLIVTVDCGVTAVEEVEYACALGIDMVITDHHECRPELPQALAVVNPKREDCRYPNKALAGVGVAFKLVCALDGNPEKIFAETCDLVAVGTVADVMPMQDENRDIVKHGINKLLESPRPGFAALMEEAGLSSKKFGASAIGFVLAPRLNAAGRLGKVEAAAKLLLEHNPKKAAEYAAALCELNRHRQGLEIEIWQSALSKIEGEPKTPLVLADEGWHQGIIGITASRLTEIFGVPAVMICLDGESGRGSCRSYGGFNLFEALEACSEHLLGFGGHALAAGLTIRRDKVDAFREALGAYYLTHLPSHGPELDIDLMVNEPGLLERDCVEDLETLEPCGNGNPRPLMCLLDTIVESVLGTGGNKHTRLRIDKFDRSYDCIYFSHSPDQLGIRAGDHIDVAFRPQLNEFRGKVTVQLVVTDIRRSDERSVCHNILEGNFPPNREGRLTPARRDFAAVWRFLTAGSTLSVTPDELIDQLGEFCADTGCARSCICIKVFEELGLLKLVRTRGSYVLVPTPSDSKTDLNASSILRRLR